MEVSLSLWSVWWTPVSVKSGIATSVCEEKPSVKSWESQGKRCERKAWMDQFNYSVCERQETRRRETCIAIVFFTDSRSDVFCTRTCGLINVWYFTRIWSHPTDSQLQFKWNDELFLSALLTPFNSACGYCFLYRTRIRFHLKWWLCLVLTLVLFSFTSHMKSGPHCSFF